MALVSFIIGGVIGYFIYPMINKHYESYTKRLFQTSVRQYQKEQNYENDIKDLQKELDDSAKKYQKVIEEKDIEYVQKKLDDMEKKYQKVVEEKDKIIKRYQEYQELLTTYVKNNEEMLDEELIKLVQGY